VRKIIGIIGFNLKSSCESESLSSVESDWIVFEEAIKGDGAGRPDGEFCSAANCCLRQLLLKGRNFRP
jgi:hypothetical protein